MDFKGSNILITAGPTIERWDAVRYLTNMASGNTGIRLSQSAYEANANVKLVTSLKNIKLDGVSVLHAESALDMFAAVKKNIDSSRIFISSAAVADFRPRRIDGKIKKKDPIPSIELQRNPDILKWVGLNYPDKLIVGFSLEDKIDIELGMMKKKEKNCSIMILNDISNLDSKLRSFVVISDRGPREYAMLSLEDTSRVILEECLKLI
ncbi:phosphopantothenoylcysteine decarboxylase [Elusimicrobiota bacterium]